MLALGLGASGTLRAADVALLIGRFGARQGPALVALACFDASAELVTDREAVSESRETTFDQDINSGDELERAMRLLATELASALQRNGRSGRTIRIKVRLDDWTTVTRARTIPARTNNYETIINVAIALLREYGPQRPVRLVGVGVAGFAPRGQQDQLELPLELPAA